MKTIALLVFLWITIPGLIWVGWVMIARAIRDWPPRLDALEAEEFGELWGRRH